MAIAIACKQSNCDGTRSTISVMSVFSRARPAMFPQELCGCPRVREQFVRTHELFPQEFARKVPCPYLAGAMRTFSAMLRDPGIYVSSFEIPVACAWLQLGFLAFWTVIMPASPATLSRITAEEAFRQPALFEPRNPAYRSKSSGRR